VSTKHLSINIRGNIHHKGYHIINLSYNSLFLSLKSCQRHLDVYKTLEITSTTSYCNRTLNKYHSNSFDKRDLITNIAIENSGASVNFNFIFWCFLAQLIYVVYRNSLCYFWISKLLYLDFQIIYLKKRIFTEVVTMLSHDQVALFKTFCGTGQSCARQTINHTASKIKQVQLQLCG